MQEAEVARLDSSDPAWRLLKTYCLSLEMVVAALPASAIAYFQFFVDPSLRFEYVVAHRILITAIALLCGFSAYIAWRCYIHTGEPFLRWLGLALFGCSIVLALHGLWPQDSAQHPWLFALYGRASRLWLVACLLIAILHFSQPADPPEARKLQPHWLAWGGIAIAADAILLAVGGLPTTGNAFLEQATELTIMALSIAAVLLLGRRTLKSPLMVMYALALAFFTQAAFAFFVAEQWSHLWWFAHVVFAAGALFLSYAIAKAFLTTCSFNEVVSPEGLIEQLTTANQQLEAALVSAREANQALSRQVDIADQAKQQFESMFALAPDATLVVGPDGRILKANERAQILFGYSEGEFSGLAVEDLMPAEHRLEHCNHRMDYQSAPEATLMSQQRILRGLRHDGSTFHAEISLGPLQFGQTPCVVAVVRDVSESRRFAEQIQQSEQRLRDIFDHAPIGMALQHLDGRFFEVNDALCELLGLPRDELVALSAFDIGHPEDVATCKASYQQLAAGKIDVYRTETRYLHRDGTPVWALISASLQRDMAGQPLHIVTQIVDIGAIKAARDALTESERRMQRVLDGSNDGFWDRHIPSGVTAFSPRWAAMLGYSSEEIAPDISSWENLVHPDDLPLCRRLQAQHLSGQRDRYEAVYRMRHRSGHWIWILARGKVYEWDETGNPVRMAGTHTDVTVRQLTMEALRMREQTLKAVLEALPIGIWIASAEGRITSANAAALAMGPGVRYRAITDDGQHDEGWGENGRTVAPHDWALARAIEKREKVREQLVEIEFADGCRKTVLNSGFPILDEQGNPLGAIAVNQDMTGWLKLEQDLLRRTRQLEESNRELEQFAYVASHDLQEPLRKVSSFAQLFAKKYSDRLDETGQTYINFMVDGASRMQILVDDLLHYSRLTRGDRPRHLVDMNSVVQGVLADLQLIVREAGAQVHADKLPFALGDAGQLRALMQNLISNAVKYRAPERIPKIEIGASIQSGEATFWVRDNGIGIDSRYFERIFVIFQRLHARSEYPGTGIGLAICKKIVDNHSGRIWLESAPDQGATFFFTLPIREVNA